MSTELHELTSLMQQPLISILGYYTIKIGLICIQNLCHLPSFLGPDLPQELTMETTDSPDKQLLELMESLEDVWVLGDLPQNNHFITLQIDGQFPNLFYSNNITETEKVSHPMTSPIKNNPVTSHKKHIIQRHHVGDLSCIHLSQSYFWDTYLMTPSSINITKHQSFR
jgi:hypothetical protein